MEFQLPIHIPSLSEPVRYGEKILLTGSCFTEHIGNQLIDWKFDVLQNPNGILFDAASVAESLVSYIQGKEFTPDDLVYFNELWHSWQHHSHFSGMDKAEVLDKINASQRRAHAFLKEAKWLVITLGSAFSYRLSTEAPQEWKKGVPGIGRLEGELPGPAIGSPVPLSVANCHRAPGKTFVKHLMTIEEIIIALDSALYQLFYFNPGIKIIFTVSPVRHIRDGVVENNRSKARLLEAVHHLVSKFDRLFYFPAYELVIDVLRDYRFFDIDMVHPNYPATSFVLEKFVQHCIDPAALPLLEAIKKIVIARRHKPFQPATQAHQRFLREHHQKTLDLLKQYPFLDLKEELDYFSQSN